MNILVKTWWRFGFEGSLFVTSCCRVREHADEFPSIIRPYASGSVAFLHSREITLHSHSGAAADGRHDSHAAQR